MLTGLSIRDIVLIDKLTLAFSPGLNVLTGETGAGKSILLDSLGLALGARADRTLVRAGEQKGVVTASFEVSPRHPACEILQDMAVDDGDGNLVLKRQIAEDGRSRAWINDEPVSQSLLSEVAATLVEIHGQHDDRGLLDASAHRALLDHYAGLKSERGSVSDTWLAYREAQKEEAELRKALERARLDEDYVRHAVAELDALAPQEGEEAELADRRTLMMQGEKAAQDLADF